MTEPTNDILSRLKHYITMMSPHQKKRVTERLLIEAADKIESLEETITELRNDLREHG